MAYVPVRSIAEQAGLTVNYDPIGRTVTVAQPQTGETEIFKPGQYRLSNGRAYVEQAASRLLSRATQAQSPVYPQLAALPTMAEVIRRAQADYADAAKKGDKERMQRAHEAAEAARRIASMIGGQNVQPAAAFSAVQSYGGKTFFDPLGYALQAAMRLPYAPGTLTLEMRKALEEARHNLATEQLERMKEERQWQQSGAAGSGLTASGTYRGYPSITPAVEKELGLSKEEIAAKARAAGVTNSQYIAAARKVKELQRAIEGALADMEAGQEWLTLQDIREAIDEYADSLKIAGINPDSLYNSYSTRLTAILHKLGGRETGGQQ